MQTPPRSHFDRREPRAERPWWTIARGVALLIGGFCLLCLVAGDFATGGRIQGRGDIVFILLFTSVTLIALWIAVRPTRSA